MRITHVISGINPVLGGTATSLIALARAQRQVGLHVAIVSTFTGIQDDTAHSLRADGVEVIEIGPAHGPTQWHPAIRPTLREEISGSNIVHIHGMWEEIQHRAAVICRAMGVPYIMMPHGMLDPWSLSKSKWKKKLYLALRLRRDLNDAVAIHFTAGIERDLVAPLGLRSPAIIESNTVDLTEFQHLPPRGGFRRRHPQLADDRQLVLFLSRVHPKKGLDLLVPAFARGAPTEAILVIAGPDSHDGYVSEVAEMARRAGVADRVLFTGMLRGIERIEAMVDADLFALPSYQENFGVVVIEALAARCPVLISDQVNIHPEISAGGVGAVVPTKIEPLAAALRQWLTDEALRAAAASRAPAFVLERYNARQIALRWADHYAAIVSRRSPG